MTISEDDLATKAMSLSGKARALPAEKLVESLDSELVSEIWLTEAKKRRDEVRSCHIKPQSRPIDLLIGMPFIRIHGHDIGIDCQSRISYHYHIDRQ